jgi:hypothetical protein
MPAVGGKFGHGLGLEAQVIALAGLHTLADPHQLAVEPRRLGPLGGAQVAVARRQREAVGGADGFTGDDLDGQRQLAHHVGEHHQLLVVLLAEQGHLGLDDVEQLQHHRGHAAEMAGPHGALEDVGVGRVGTTW